MSDGGVYRLTAALTLKNIEATFFHEDKFSPQGFDFASEVKIAKSNPYEIPKFSKQKKTQNSKFLVAGIDARS